jgi:hypothetical protein
LTIISNLLCRSGCSNELATASQIPNIKFELLTVDGIRGTDGIYLRYVGSDSNGVERVASNACVMVERLYATNNSDITITYWGTSSTKPALQQEFEYWVWRASR